MKKLFFLLCLLLLINGVYSQQRELQNFRVICYNVENYFDTNDDPDTDDCEYLPGGMRGWNYAKYKQKQANIAKVITAIGGWNTPALVGLCEIENEKCLTDLTRYSGLKELNYKFIHYESPDTRGVDVALLYHPYQFFPIHSEAVTVKFSQSTQTTRDILYVSGTTVNNDTLHVFVCHFPSRLDGELESEYKRIYSASILKQKVDSIFSAQEKVNILIMGDFNDYPTNKSLMETLSAIPPEQPIDNNSLYNLTYTHQIQNKGTHKHNGEWGMFDQFIVSGNLLNATNPFFTLQQDVRIFEGEFLLEDDVKYMGKKPFRTYAGMKYNGGYSDHLPIYMDFWYPINKLAVKNDK